MKSFSIFLWILVCLIASCSQSGTQRSLNHAVSIEISSDSVLAVQYLDWLDSIKYIGFPDIRNSVFYGYERDTNVLTLFANTFLDSFYYFREINPDVNQLFQYLYTVDFDADGLQDIVYQGPTGAEPTLTDIFKQVEDGFIKIFSGDQAITDLQFKDKKLYAFTLVNPGCCADPQVIEYFYKVIYSGEIPKFSLLYSKAYLSTLEKLQNEFPEPKNFTITSDSAKLRTESYILDVMHPIHETAGNTIVTYIKGSKGKAYGSKTNRFGKWLYVSMDAENKPINHQWFEDITNAEIYGWILQNETSLN